MTGYLEDHSGTINAANISQQAAPININRGYLIVQNHSADDPLFANFGEDANAGQPSIRIEPLTALVYEFGFIPANSVHVFSATEGHPFTCKEG